MMTITSFDAKGSVRYRHAVPPGRLTAIPIGEYGNGAYTILCHDQTMITYHTPLHGKLEIEAEARP